MVAGEKIRSRGKNEKRERKTEENYIKNGGKGIKNASFWGFFLGKNDRNAQYISLDSSLYSAKLNVIGCTDFGSLDNAYSLLYFASSLVKLGKMITIPVHEALWLIKKS